jgi:hypothetical protein
VGSRTREGTLIPPSSENAAGGIFHQFVLRFRKLVVGVKIRNFVALRQRWIIKDCREEVLQPPFRMEYGLSDVNKLGGPRADRMYAQQPVVMSME